MPDRKMLHTAWRSYRRGAFLAVSGLGTSVTGWAVLQDAAPSVRNNPWFGVPLLAFFAIGVVGLLRVWYFRCPRCGSPFHQKRGSLGFSSSKCQNCGLLLWGHPGGAQPPS
jgi:hypothetical protein